MRCWSPVRMPMQHTPVPSYNSAVGLIRSRIGKVARRDGAQAQIIKEPKRQRLEQLVDPVYQSANERHPAMYDLEQVL